MFNKGIKLPLIKKCGTPLENSYENHNIVVESFSIKF